MLTTQVGPFETVRSVYLLLAEYLNWFVILFLVWKKPFYKGTAHLYVLFFNKIETAYILIIPQNNRGPDMHLFLKIKVWFEMVNIKWYVPFSCAGIA